ncbi:MAG: hypothetical protein JNG84_06935 [Archangium sp.]|nr:hypothetical protein [Archangium sp.]
MKRTLWATLCTLAVTACGPVEIRLDETKGIPAVTGSVEFNLGTFTCGQPIAAGTEQVVTKVVGDGCELSFDRTVTVLKESDYTGIPDLKGVTNLVQRIELTIKALKFTDVKANQTLDVQTRVTSASLAINGQTVIADKTVVASLPKTVSLDGSALTPLKTAIDGRKAASAALKVVLVVPNSPAPPETMKIDYDAQPAIIIGPGKIL